MEKKFDSEKIKEFSKLTDLRRCIEERGDLKLTYYGLKNLTPDGKYPLFVAWNHKYPIIGVTKNTQSVQQETMFPFPREIAEAIEIFLGNARDSQDFEDQIEEAFKRKDEENKAKAKH